MVQGRPSTPSPTDTSSHQGAPGFSSARRNARTRRAQLLREVFRAGYGIRRIAQALMGRRRLDEEELLPWRRELNAHRMEEAEVRAWASDWMLEEALIADIE